MFLLSCYRCQRSIPEQSGILFFFKQFIFLGGMARQVWLARRRISEVQTLSYLRNETGQVEIKHHYYLTADVWSMGYDFLALAALLCELMLTVSASRGNV